MSKLNETEIPMDVLVTYLSNSPTTVGSMLIAAGHTPKSIQPYKNYKITLVSDYGDDPRLKVEGIAR